MRRAAALLVCLLALGGCRSVSPLAPKSQVQSLLANVAVNCGQATEIHAYGEERGRLPQLDRQAANSGRGLVRIMRADPQATYLGLTMRRVVDTVASATKECGLLRTSSLLTRSLG
jgi:hypothetical protein